MSSCKKDNLKPSKTVVIVGAGHCTSSFFLFLCKYKHQSYSYNADSIELYISKLLHHTIQTSIGDKQEKSDFMSNSCYARWPF